MLVEQKCENELLRAELREALAALEQFRQAMYFAVNVDYTPKAKIGLEKARQTAGRIVFKHQRKGFF